MLDSIYCVNKPYQKNALNFSIFKSILIWYVCRILSTINLIFNVNAQVFNTYIIFFQYRIKGKVWISNAVTISLADRLVRAANKFDCLTSLSGLRIVGFRALLYWEKGTISEYYFVNMIMKIDLNGLTIMVRKLRNWCLLNNKIKL